MNDKLEPPRINRGSLQELIGGLGDGILLIDQAGAIAWANDAAIVMHRVKAIDDLGRDAAGYRRRFTLRYRNNHPRRVPIQLPITSTRSASIPTRTQP